MQTVYIPLIELNTLQTDIMIFIEYWVHKERTPIPRGEIVKNMKKKGIKDFTTKNAIKSLLTKGYIRRAIITSNKTFYVQCRSL